MPKNKGPHTTGRTPSRARAAHPYSNAATPRPVADQDDTEELATLRTRRSARLQTLKRVVPVDDTAPQTPLHDAPQTPLHDAPQTPRNDVSGDDDASDSDNTIQTRACDASQAQDALRTPTSSLQRTTFRSSSMQATSTRREASVDPSVARASSAVPGGLPSSPLTEMTSDVEWQTGSAYRVNARSSPRPDTSSRFEHRDVSQVAGALASPFTYARDTSNVSSTARELRDTTSVMPEGLDDVGGQRSPRTPEQRRRRSVSTSQTAYTQAEEGSDIAATPRGVPSDVHRIVGPDGHPDVRPDNHRDDGLDNHPDVGTEVRLDVGRDPLRDAEIDGRHDVKANVRDNAEVDVGPNIGAHACSNIEADASCNATNTQHNGAREPRSDVTVFVQRSGGGADVALNVEGHLPPGSSAGRPPSLHPHHVSGDVYHGSGPLDTNTHRDGVSHPQHSVGPYPPYNLLPETRPYPHYNDPLNIHPYAGTSAHPHNGALVHYEARAIQHHGGYSGPHHTREQRPSEQDDSANVQWDNRANAQRDDGANVQQDDGANAQRDDGANVQRDDGANVQRDDGSLNRSQDGRQNAERDVGVSVRRVGDVDPRFDFTATAPGGVGRVHPRDDTRNFLPARDHLNSDPRPVLRGGPSDAALAGPSRLANQHDEGATFSDHLEDLDDAIDDNDIDIDANPDIDVDMDMDMDINLDIDVDGPRAAGRISNENKKVLRDAFDSMYEKVKDVASITGQAQSQVLDQFFSATHTRVHHKNNTWNTYSAYFAANIDQEIKLLPNAQRILEKAPFRNSREVRKACYDAFKARHGVKVSAILAKFRALEEMNAGQSQTVAQRSTEFRKKFLKLQVMADSFQTIYGFAGVVALLGNVVNSDAGLAKVHETQDAKGFFNSICRTDKDGVVSHLKAHVYNKVSLENVALAYGDKGTVSPDVPGPLLLKTGVGRKSGAQPSKAQVAKSSSGKGNNRGADSDGDDGDDEVVDTAKNEKTAKIQDGDDGDDEEESDDDDLTIIKDRPKYIIKRFRRMLREINAGHIISESMFPWKKLLRNFAEGGVIIKNWPEQIPLPPLPKGAKQPAKTADKPYLRGIAGMPTALQDVFIFALRDPDLPLCFERYSGPSSDLLRSREPVINGAPPSPTSKYKAGRRVFVNGAVDRQGVPRLVEASKKGGKKPLSRTPTPESEAAGPAPPEKTGLIVPETQPIPVSSNQKTRARQSQLTSSRRHVEVLIQTTPNKRPPRGPPSPSEVHEVISSAGSGSEDEYIPSDSAAHPPQGTKRKARRHSLNLASSDSGSDCLPAAPFSGVPAAGNKGKARADDVGLRTPTPPRSNPPPKTDISERPLPAAVPHDSVDTHRAKLRRVEAESPVTHDARPPATVGPQRTRTATSVPARAPQDAHDAPPGDLQRAERHAAKANANTEHTIPPRGPHVLQGSSGGPPVVTHVGDQRATEANDVSHRRPAAAPAVADPSQQGYAPQPHPSHSASWYPPSDAHVQDHSMVYAHDSSGAGPPPVVMRTANGGGADNLGQGMAAPRAQMPRVSGELPLAQGAHGQGAAMHDKEHAAAMPPPNPVYGHYNPGNQYPYGYHYADTPPARYPPPSMYPPGAYPYQPPPNMFGYPGPAGYPGGFLAPPPPGGDPRYVSSQQGTARPPSPAVYHPPPLGYAGIPPAGAPRHAPPPSSMPWQGPTHHAPAGPAPSSSTAALGQQHDAGPGHFGTVERQGGAPAS